MDTSHYTVLREEAVDGLKVKEGGTYVDATMGGGGHSSLIAERIGSEGTLIGIDQDAFAQKKAQERLQDYPCKKIFIQDNFSNLKKVLEDQGIDHIDGILYDLGVSSFQLDDQERGFSYHNDGPLDMRMNTDQQLTAEEIVNTYPKEELIKILRDYGEERFTGRIVNQILETRKDHPITTTKELSELVRKAYPAKQRFKGKHPARKTFQALRIAVNSELDILKPSFDQALEFLTPGGRISVISFHSLEDRQVKQYFKKKENPCTCPPDFPVCVCGNKPELKIINRKPILPSEEELEENNRSRSAKLRVAEKI